MKHRALIVGAGRIGAGFKFGPWPYVYTHADAYLALRERVELVGFVEPDEERATAAETKYKLPVYGRLSKAILEHQEVDIVSVCVQPETQQRLVDMLIESDFVNGIFCEKPFMARDWYRLNPPYINVNYIRRADINHLVLKGIGRGILRVWAKKDIHTVCHFTDLARYWGLPKENLEYHPIDGPNHYEYAYNDKVIHFENGGVTGGFMERMLGNLLDAVDTGVELISPPENAVESEKWANEILEKA